MQHVSSNEAKGRRCYRWELPKEDVVQPKAVAQLLPYRPAFQVSTVRPHSHWATGRDEALLEFTFMLLVLSWFGFLTPLPGSELFSAETRAVLRACMRARNWVWG